MNLPISYNWLRSHFDKDIPNPDDIAALFTKKLAEVEGVERKDNDTIFDLKVMPDRGHDLLSHRGVAREVAVLSGVPLKTSEKLKVESGKSGSTTTLRVAVEDAKLCPRYIGRVIENIKTGESPAWLRERLESVGQRSINNIVDITNYVMLELGQPMHAFDLQQLVSNDRQQATIEVRRAREGEKITTLDNKEISLTPEIFVIADNVRALAIAGVKGGKDAGVNEATTSIIFESANFDPVEVRRASRRVGIRTDSSKRFEHGLSPVLALEAMDLATTLLLEVCPDARVSAAVDVYPEPQKEHTITVSTEDVNGILGSTLSGNEIEEIIKRLGFVHTRDENTFTVTPSFLRLDLTIKEDLVEEIGRVYGLDKIPDVPLPEISFTPHPLKAYYYANVVRDALVAHGFSEVYTSSFRDQGVFAVANPLAEDKGFLREELTKNLEQALVLNMRNAPLLGLDEVKIFEIGKVFPGVMVEKLSCAFGAHIAKNMKKKDEETKKILENVRLIVSEALGVSLEGAMTQSIFEFDLGALLERLPEPQIGTPFTSIETRYEKISVYPFVLRDIALWAPEGTTSNEILNVIVDKAGELLRTKRLFDVFTKEFPEGKKTSHAFNLIFQSHEKTLSDDEVNGIMDRITTALVARGWEVR